MDARVCWSRGMTPDEEAAEHHAAGAGGDLDLDNDFKAWLEHARSGSLPGITPGHIDNVDKLVQKYEKIERKVMHTDRELQNLSAKAAGVKSSEVRVRQCVHSTAE